MCAVEGGMAGGGGKRRKVEWSDDGTDGVRAAEREGAGQRELEEDGACDLEMDDGLSKAERRCVSSPRRPPRRAAGSALWGPCATFRGPERVGSCLFGC